MTLSRQQELQKKKDELETELAGVATEYNALHPEQTWELGPDRESRERELRRLKIRWERLKAEINSVDQKLSSLFSVISRTKAKKVTKQDEVDQQFAKLQKRYPKWTTQEIIDQIADDRDESATSVRKAYYDAQAKRRKKKAGKAKAKRDTDTQSDQSNQGDEKSHK